MHTPDQKFLDECYAVEDDGITRYLRRWQFGLGSWIYKKKQRYYKEVVPFFTIFDAQLYPKISSSQKDAVTTQKNTDALAAWIREIPDNLKTPAFVALERYQFIALEACQHAHGFDAFVEQEYRSGSFNFLFAAWCLHAQIDQPPEYRKRFNRKLLRQKRGDILAFFMGAKIPPLFFKLLARSNATLLDEDSLRILLAASRHKLFARSLSSVTTITNPGLSLAWENLPEWLYHPNILQCLMQLPEETQSLAAIIPPSIIDAEEKNRKRIVTSLGSAKTLEQFEKRLYKLSFQFSLEEEFPPPPFAGTALLFPVKTGKALHSEGKYMHNCVAGYSASIIAGDYFFYHFAGDEQATVLLKNERGGGWSVHEHLGIDNSRLAEKTLTQIYLEAAKFTATDQTLFFDQTRVAGFYYRKSHALWKNLKANQNILLSLRAEPDNPYDARAIAVDFQGEHIGYIPRTRNRLLGTLMNSGFDLKAATVSVGDSYDSAEIRIRVLSAGKKTAAVSNFATKLRAMLRGGE